MTDAERPEGHFSPVRAFYDRRAHEDDLARVVSWRAVWDQEYRFEVLCEILDRKPPGRVSILDVGCGLGDLVGYLRRRGDDVDYLGVDILPEMVEAARKRFPDERFETIDILKEEVPGAPFDYVMASGALSVKVPGHERFVHDMLERMLELCTKGLALNMQSAAARSRNVTAQLETDIYYADPIELYRECRRICPRTVLREDFVTTDFGLFLYPGETRSHRGYQAYLDACPDRDDGPVGMAYLFLEQHLPNEALAALKGAPDDAEVCNYRGLSYLHLGQPKDAIEPLRRSVELDPTQYNAPVNLGVALSMLRRHEESITVWQDALRHRPDNDSARLKLANALMLNARPDEAEVVARDLKDASLRDNLLGLAIALQGRREEGLQILASVAERNPDMAKVRFEMGEILEQMGCEAEAVDRYLEALTIYPEHRAARKAARQIALRRRGQGKDKAAAVREVVARYDAEGVEVAAGMLKELDR